VLAGVAAAEVVAHNSNNMPEPAASVERNDKIQ
jgi:hypothetical protein